MNPPIKLDAATARWLAVEAGVDPKTIAKVARGEKVRGMAGHRALVALRAAGLLEDGDPKGEEGASSQHVAGRRSPRSGAP